MKTQNKSFYNVIELVLHGRLYEAVQKSGMFFKSVCFLAQYETSEKIKFPHTVVLMQCNKPKDRSEKRKMIQRTKAMWKKVIISCDFYEELVVPVLIKEAADLAANKDMQERLSKMY